MSQVLGGGTDEGQDRGRNTGASIIGAAGRIWSASLAARPIAWLGSAFEAERARWALWIPVVFGIGVTLYFQASTEPRLVTAWCWPAMAIALLVVTTGTGARLASIGLVLVGLGFAAAKTRTEYVRAPVLEAPIAKADVAGTVTLVEPRPGGGVRITLRDLEIKGLAKEQTPRLARIRVLRPGAPTRPGDRVRLSARLSPPQAPALPGGYDFARTAWFWGLGATGFAFRAPVLLPPTNAEDASVVARIHAMARDGLENIRQSISERIAAAVPGELGALATALITGERGGISEETTEAFRNSGLLHILSISGLHMVVMAGAVYTGIRALLAMAPAFALGYPIRRWAAAAASIAALGYLLLSGASIATVRAYLMIAIMLLAVMMDRPALAMRNVAASALLILVLMPESILDPGFQMSFACVVALVSAYETLRHRRAAGDGDRTSLGPMVDTLLGFASHLREIVISTLIASAAVAPFAIYHFHKSQQFALIANLIAIPITNIIVMPAGLLTLLAMPFGLEALPLAIMSAGIEAMRATAVWVASFPGAVSRVSEISTLSFGLMIAGGLWLVLWQTRWRLLGLAGLAAGIACAPWHARPTLLVGEGGRLVAVRSASGDLQILAERSTTFALTQWLEHDGDERDPKAARAKTAFSCDNAGCTIEAPEVGIVAVTRHESGFEDDCRRADVLIARSPMIGLCPHPRLVIDGRSMYRTGPVSLYVDAGLEEKAAEPRLRLVTSADLRGERPWASAKKEVKEAKDHPGKPVDPNGATGFSSEGTEAQQLEDLDP